MKMEAIKKDIKTSHTADVSSSFSLTDSQIEIIADLFSRREHLVVKGRSPEWLLNHAFQLGMKFYRDLQQCNMPRVSNLLCSCEMPAKVKGKNECWRCKRPLKEFLQTER